MINRLSSARRNVIPYLALLVVLVVGAGGGYAFAASKTKTITVCADKKTGILHLHNRGKCARGQTKVTWNQQGPQGPQGATGAAGASAVSVWAQVANDGSVAFGNGIAVQHVSTGTYQVTITAPACAQSGNAPVITVSDAAPANQSPGAFPVAWYESTGLNDEFNVFTGRETGGSFMPTDLAFTLMDTCT